MGTTTDRRGTHHERRRTPARTSVLVADGDREQRLATVELIAGDAAVRVLADTTPDEAAAVAARLTPDVVLLDVDPRAAEGKRLVAAIISASARSRVVVLTAVGDPAAVVEALAAGASGYLLKERAERRLAHAIHEVIDGRVPLDHVLTEALRERLDAPAPTPAPEHRLTPRELTVLARVATGMTNEQIAQDLVLSAGTVKLHVQHIISKLGVANRTQAAVYAARNGLVDS